MRPEELTLAQASAALRARRLSPVDYVEALLAQIARVDPEIQAWVTVDREGAFAAAGQCEEDIAQGRYKGPMHGIPIGVKDIFHTRNLRTTAGTKVFADFVPEHDAESVRRLREAGAIILGKTVTTPFATFDPGPTRNPVNPNHTPGGSSSGSAAAVAARMCPGALGSQTVASIGRPAAYCGTVGFMPTQARVSRKGVFPVSWSLDHVGGFGRTVEDVEILLSAMAETAIEPSALQSPARIGVVRTFFDDRMEPHARARYDATVQQIAESGLDVREVQPSPLFDVAIPTLMVIMRAEIASAHADLYQDFSDSYGRKLQGLIETGKLLDAGMYLRAKRLRKRYQTEMMTLFGEVDVLLSPGAPGPAPAGLESTGDPSFSAAWSLADFPTLTLPAGSAGNNLPLGIQLTAAPLEESRLFAIGKLVEAALAG